MTEQTRRKHIPVDRAVSIQTAKGRQLHSNLAGLSNRGAEIIYPDPTRPGRKMLLRFALPIKGRLKEIKAHAEVVSTRLSGDQFLAHVQFVGMSPEDRSALDHFIRDVSTLRSQG